MPALIDQPTTRRENRSQVDHDRDVKPAFGRPDIGEVGNPFPVGSRCSELPVKLVRGNGCNLTSPSSFGRRRRRGLACKACRRNQPLDPVQATIHTLGQQITPDAAGTIGPVAVDEAGLEIVPLIAWSLRDLALGARLSQAWKSDRETPSALHSHTTGQTARCFDIKANLMSLPSRRKLRPF